MKRFCYNGFQNVYSFCLGHLRRGCPKQKFHRYEVFLMSDKVLILEAGRTLFRQGDKGGDLYFITKGTVELSTQDADSTQNIILATLKGKNVIGTMSFVA